MARLQGRPTPTAGTASAAPTSSLLEVIKNMNVYVWFFLDKAGKQHAVANLLEGWWREVPAGEVDFLTEHWTRNEIPWGWHESKNPSNKTPRYVADPHRLAPRGEIPFNGGVR